jgi:hypothetical protein
LEFNCVSSRDFVLGTTFRLALRSTQPPILHSETTELNVVSFMLQLLTFSPTRVNVDVMVRRKIFSSHRNLSTIIQFIVSLY